MENLKDYMLLFRLAPDSRQPSTEELSVMHREWGAFIGGIAAKAKLVSTSRLDSDGTTVGPNQLAVDGIESTSQTLSGNLVLKAYSLNEAAEIAKGCPVLSIGGSDEVRSIIPMQS